MTSTLKNRKRFGNTLDKKLLLKLHELHNETQIPISKLLDEAVIMLLIKYEKPLPEGTKK